jgi:hypothetical protein
VVLHDANVSASSSCLHKPPDGLQVPCLESAPECFEIRNADPRPEVEWAGYTASRCMPKHNTALFGIASMALREGVRLHREVYLAQPQHIIGHRGPLTCMKTLAGDVRVYACRIGGALGP